MGRYNETETGVFSVFSTIEWKALGIKTYPSNYINVDDSEFIRVSIIPSNKGINKISISGIINIDIFSLSGKGPKRFHIISDLLDAYLVGKSKTTLSGIVQFKESALDLKGIDKDNPTLYRALYTIPFSLYISEV